MKAIIKSVISADIDDLDSWKPSDPDDVVIPLELEIGPDDDEGTDLFQVLVATKTGLRMYRQTVSDPVDCPHLVVLQIRLVGREAAHRFHR